MAKLFVSQLRGYYVPENTHFTFCQKWSQLEKIMYPRLTCGDVLKCVITLLESESILFVLYKHVICKFKTFCTTINLYRILYL